jgi:hypothetical protein
MGVRIKSKLKLAILTRCMVHGNSGGGGTLGPCLTPSAGGEGGSPRGEGGRFTETQVGGSRKGEKGIIKYIHCIES